MAKVFEEVETSPAPGRHVRSPMGMRSISVGLAGGPIKKSAIGAASGEV